MSSRTRYPRLLAVCRGIVYLFASVATLVLLGVTLSFLGFVAVLGTVLLLLVGDGSVFVAATVGGLGLVVSVLFAYLLVGTTKSVDRYLVHIAQVPSPLEQVKKEYLDGHIDEWGLERRIEQILVTESNDTRITRPLYLSSPFGRTTVPARSGEVEVADERCECENELSLCRGNSRRIR